MEERDGWMQRTEKEREGEIRERKEIRGRKAKKGEGGLRWWREREWSLCSVSRKYSQDRIKRNFLSFSLKYLNSSSMSPSMSLS